MTTTAQPHSRQPAWTEDGPFAVVLACPCRTTDCGLVRIVHDPASNPARPWAGAWLPHASEHSEAPYVSDGQAFPTLKQAADAFYQAYHDHLPEAAPDPLLVPDPQDEVASLLCSQRRRLQPA